MPTQPLRQADFKEFERLYASVRAANRAERQDAVGLMTPKLIREHLKSGRDLVLAYGRRGATVTYTVQDLQKFAQEIKKAQGKHRSDVAGVPLLQLEGMSDPVDKARATKQIKAAMLYKVLGNLLTFQVTASEESDRRYHQVKIRLEDWNQRLLDTDDWNVSARAASMGRISFDCTCERHQFWYRYLATLGNFAVAPLEKDFPKIRNPQLKGCCCKHVLKVLRVLKSNNVTGILAKHMKEQAASIGYLDKKAAKFLSPGDLLKAKRAKGTEKETSEARAAYRQFQASAKAFRRKMTDKEAKERIKSLEAQVKARKAREAALARRVREANAQARRDAMANKLRGWMDASLDMGMDREEALARFASKNELSREEIIAITQDYGI